MISVVVMLLSIFNPYLVGNIINILTNNQDLKELYGGIILLTVVWGMYVFLEYVYTVAGGAKFLRIYYAKVKEYLNTIDLQTGCVV